MASKLSFKHFLKHFFNLLLPLVALAFFSFILWVIYLANTGQNSIFFQLVAAIPYGDKLGHFCLFGSLTLMMNFALKLKSFKLYASEIFLGSLLVASFVVIEECSQYFLPNRNFELIDLSADFLGIVLFNWLTGFIKKLTLKKRINIKHNN